VALPTYPFERQRYWVAPGEAGPTVTAGGADMRGGAGRAQRSEVGEWFYLPSWRPTLRPAQGGGWGEGRGLWMVFDEGAGVGRKVAEGLRAQGREVAVVRRGDEYGRAGQCEYVVGEGREQYVRAMREAEAEAGAGHVSGVIHLWALGAEERGAEEMQAGEGWREEFERAQRAGYYSLLRVVQAVAEGAGESGVAEVLAVTAGAQAGAGEGGRAEWATMAGVSKVAGQETGGLRCGVVDVERGEGEAWAEQVAERVLAEARGGVRDGEVRWRGGRRWVRSFEQVKLERDNTPLRGFREGGVYLITGGLGGVGLLLAEHLAGTVGARLVLTGRSSFPEQGEWQEWLASRGEEDEVSRRIRRLQAVEELGGEVLIARADVADEEQMRAVLGLASQRFGGVNGVIHAAGVTRGESVFAPFTEIGEPESSAQFLPKAHGAYVLERVLDGLELDFCLLMSSNAAVLGGLGLTAYSAANGFMDSFVSDGRRGGGFPWISANWDHWFSESESGYQTGVDQFTMSPTESLDAFERVVSYVPEGQVVVATGSLPERLRTWVERDASTPSAARGPNAVAASHPRPTMGVAYEPPRNETERVIAEVWSEVLGVEQVGAGDNFFELGGHSLQATTVVTRLRGAFHIDLPLKKFFEDPTVSGLAQAVAELRGERQGGDEAEVLELLAQLSDEEADAEIRRMTNTQGD
jgi:NAD(P)-dependent dehydrogenase (short-subunit alcohol dehydrogenase family)/acyl carrier protein